MALGCPVVPGRGKQVECCNSASAAVCGRYRWTSQSMGLQPTARGCGLPGCITRPDATFVNCVYNIKFHNNTGSYLYHLLSFYYVWHTNQPTITGVDLCHKKLDIHDLESLVAGFQNEHSYDCCELDGPGNRIPVGTICFAPSQTGTGAHPFSYTADIGSLFPGVQRPGRGVNHPPHLAPRLKKEHSYTSTPLPALHGLF